MPTCCVDRNRGSVPVLVRLGVVAILGGVACTGLEAAVNDPEIYVNEWLSFSTRDFFFREH